MHLEHCIELKRLLLGEPTGIFDQPGPFAMVPSRVGEDLLQVFCPGQSRKAPWDDTLDVDLTDHIVKRAHTRADWAEHKAAKAWLPAKSYRASVGAEEVYAALGKTEKLPQHPVNEFHIHADCPSSSKAVM
jgi:hypothetical protein